MLHPRGVKMLGVSKFARSFTTTGLRYASNTGRYYTCRLILVHSIVKCMSVGNKFVLGCGSNVVDHIYNVRGRWCLGWVQCT